MCARICRWRSPLVGFSWQRMRKTVVRRFVTGRGKKRGEKTSRASLVEAAGLLGIGSNTERRYQDPLYKTIVSFKYALKGEAMYQKIRGRWQPMVRRSVRPSIRAEDIQLGIHGNHREPGLNLCSRACLLLSLLTRVERVYPPRI